MIYKWTVAANDDISKYTNTYTYPLIKQQMERKQYCMRGVLEEGR